MKKVHKRYLGFLLAIAAMVLSMGFPVKAMAQSNFNDADTASVTPVTKPSNIVEEVPRFTLGTDTGTTANTPSDGAVRPDGDAAMSDDELRKAIMNCINYSGSDEIDLQYIDSAFHMRLSDLNIQVSMQNIDSVLRAEIRKIDDIEDTPTVDYFIEAIRRSNKYNDSGSGLVNIERISVAPKEGNDVIYDLSGQRLPAPPAHGIYIRNGKKILAK